MQFRCWFISTTSHVIFGKLTEAKIIAQTEEQIYALDLNTYNFQFLYWADCDSEASIFV